MIELFAKIGGKMFLLEEIDGWCDKCREVCIGDGWLAGVFFIRKGHWTKYEASIRATRKTSIDELDSQLRERIGDAN